jgi:hypothetical protein
MEGYIRYAFCQKRGKWLSDMHSVLGQVSLHQAAVKVAKCREKRKNLLRWLKHRGENWRERE